MIVEKIHQYLAGEGKSIEQSILDDIARMSSGSFSRQFGAREERGRSLRLSSIGRCPRQSAYSILGFPENGKSIDARARMVFAMGDLTELVVVGLAKAAGCVIESTGDKQSTVQINGVPGHPDGILIDSGKRYLLEVKSMSSFSFKDFERGVLDEGYRYQCNAYMTALDLNECVIVALNKDAGVLSEMTISKDPAIVRDIKFRINLIQNATKENLPVRPFAPDPKGFYPWPCLYCPFHQTCLPNAEKVVVSNRYKLKEKPNVTTPKTQTN